MTTTSTYTETELIRLLQQKSKQGFDHLYENYSSALYGVIIRVIGDDKTAQDVLQDVFIKIWKNIDKFDPEKGRLYTWMLNLARNTAIDKLRSKGERMRSKIQTGEDIVNDNREDLKTESDIDSIGLKEVVASLKDEYQIIVELAYFKGFTLNEISKAIDVPLGTVKTRMRKAMTLLKEHYSS